MMKKIIIALLSVITLTEATAQIEKYIPSDASLVVGLNLKELSGKVSTEDVEKMEFFQYLKSEYEKELEDEHSRNQFGFFPLLVDADSVGLSTSDNAYVYITNKKDYSVFTLLLTMKDKELFLHSLQQATDKKNSMFDEVIKGTLFDNISLDQETNIAWNDTYISFSGVVLYDGTYPEELKAVGVDKKEFATKKALEFHTSIFSQTMKRSLNKNTSFKKIKRKKNDLFIWTSSENLISESMIGLFEKELRKNKEIDLSSLLRKDWIKDISAGLDFNKGEIVLETQIKFGDELKGFTKKIYRTHLNQQFEKYIDKDKSLVVSSGAINPEEMIPLFKKLYLDISSSIHEVKPINKDAYELFDLVVNQKGIMNLFSGEVAFSFQGIKPQSVEYTSYNYTEDYKYEEVIRKDTIEIPQFLYLLGTNDKKHVQNILNIVEYTKLIIKEEEYYTFTENRVDYYIALVGDLLLVTNNKEMVTTYREGLPRGQQYRFPRRGNGYSQVDAQKIGALLLTTLTNPWDRDERSYTKAMLNYVDNAVSRTRVNKRARYKIKLKLKNVQGNSFNTLLHFFNKIYVTLKEKPTLHERATINKIEYGVSKATENMIRDVTITTARPEKGVDSRTGEEVIEEQEEAIEEVVK